MNRGIHPALAFAKQVEGWSPGVFSHVDKWRETDSLAPWRFMTFRQCKRWLAAWPKRNPAPEEGFLCPQIMKRFPPHIVYMTLAAWRTGKTLLHCDESLFRMLGETVRLTHSQEKCFAACHSGDSGSISRLTRSLLKARGR